MADILSQLGVDQTFLVQFAVIGLLVLVLSNLYFKAFYRLFELRHKRTVEDQKAATEILEQANQKLAEYKKKINEERVRVRAEIDAAVTEAKKAEAEILGNARAQAKQIMTETQAQLEVHGQQIRQQLSAQVPALVAEVIDQMSLIGGQTK